MTKSIKATHQGELNLGGTIISCAVLDNGQRVLVERSLANALERRGGGAYWKDRKSGKKDLLPEYLSASYLREFISDELQEKLSPITYVNLQGKKAIGIDANFLPDICDVWVSAKNKGVLQGTQITTAEKAYILMKAFAAVGITALIDEATGYQELRDKHALAELLDKFLRKEHALWAKRFPDDFYKELFRLRGWEWKGMKVNRPSYVGTLTNDIVYERLAPEIVAELEKKNPKTEAGYRKYRHHQWLTEDIGIPALSNHLYAVLGLMRASATWENFYNLLQRAFPKKNEQMLLNFDESEDTTKKQSK